MSSLLSTSLPLRTPLQFPPAQLAHAPLPVVVSAVRQCADELLLTSIQAAHVPAATGAILKLMLFADQSADRYFSYTHTNGGAVSELSLLLSPAECALFPEGQLSFSPGSWRILEVLEGSEIIDTPGIVSSLCAPLLRKDADGIAGGTIDELLYLSTYISDLILVRQAHVDRAEAVVANSLHFLLESRRKAQEALAAAEVEEAQAAVKRLKMEEDDLRRANEDDTAEAAEAAEAELDEESAAANDRLLPFAIPMPSRDDARGSGGSVASSLSEQSGIFKFSLVSSASTLLPTADPLPSAAAHTVAATPVPLHSTAASLPTAAVASHAAFAHAASSSAVTAASAPSHFAMESEGPADGDEEAGSDDGISMHLSRLSFRLALLTFDVAHLPACTYAILSALMRNQPDSAASAATSAACFRPSFFSFTQAGRQISLIVETSCLPLFPPHLVVQHSRVWNALMISQGIDSVDSVGLVAPLSQKLAQANVSIFYLSTSNLDIILVPEQQIDVACAMLEREARVIIERD